MTATPAKTYRYQLEEMLARLEAKAEALLRAEVWDEDAMEFTAKLRWAFLGQIAIDDEEISHYLSDGWGCCSFTEEEIAQGVPFKIDQWTDDYQAWDGFYHDYLSQGFEGIEKYLPEDWVEHFSSEPTRGAEMLERLQYYVSDPQILLEEDAFIDEPEMCGQVMVSTGYLTNQEHIQDDKLTVLLAFTRFTEALEEALGRTKEGG